MSTGMSTGGSNSQDFDLNLAPIIDCFTVLITFMLASASFLSIGILDAGVAAGAPTAAAGTPPPIALTVELKENHAIVIDVSGKERQTLTIPSKGTDYDLDSVGQRLAGVHSRWPSASAATLTAQNGTEYRDVVKTMEVVRKTFPAVLLGGF